MIFTSVYVLVGRNYKDWKIAGAFALTGSAFETIPIHMDRDRLQILNLFEFNENIYPT